MTQKELLPVAILAGGLATRLRPMTETVPKALIPINGLPFIHHQLRLLKQQGVRRVVLCVGYLGEMIEQVIGHGDEFGLEVSYSYDGDTLLGTAGALKKASPLLGDAFFVLYGDSYLTCDYAAIQSAFFASKQMGLMTVFENGDQWDTSNVEFQHGQIIAYDKKMRTSRMRYIDYGAGIFSKQAFQFVTALPYDLALLYQSLLKEKQLAAFEVKQRFYEVGSFAGIAELEQYLNI